MTSIPQTLKINSNRLKTDFEELAEIGSTVAGGVSRLALSNEDLEARAWFANKIEDAGFLVRDDEVGNLSGVYLSADRDAKTLLIGSHLDSVPNGGLYDGTIGVLAGLECIRTLHDAKIELPFHVEVIDFTDEEGWWQSFFGSLGLTGRLEKSHINDTEQDNAAFRAALFRAGIRPNEVQQARRNPEDLLAYLELHIEQGERLSRSNCDVGIVTGVVGRSTYTFSFYGEATHAATTLMEKRRDALQGAAMFITEMHKMVSDDYPDGVINCGNVHVKPGTYSVVPSEASLRVECRHPNGEKLSDLESRLVRLAHDCARDHRLSVSSSRIIHRPVGEMSQHIYDLLQSVCDDSGYTHCPIVSFAGHDAQILATFTPSGMIFVPSQDGISHNPKEFTDWKYVEAGANVLLQTILKLANGNTHQE